MLDTRFAAADEIIIEAQYDGIRTVYAADTSHLYVYDIYNENITHILEVPGEALVSVRDMVVAGTRGAYVAALLPYGGIMDYWDGTLTNMTLGVSEDTYFDCLASSPDGNTLYMGGWNTGVIVYDLVDRDLTNITIEDGLLSNQINEVYATRNSLLIGSSVGFQIYDLMERTFVNQTTEPDSSEILNPLCIEYLEASKELYLGTEHGLHIYRYTDTELVYLKTIGPADGLPSATVEDIDLDITSHKLIISTRLGVCINDIFSGLVERVKETMVYHCTAVSHRYNGPICQIYFGTWQHGLLRLNIDYTPVASIDIGYFVQTMFGFVLGLFGIAFGTLFQEYREKRKKRKEAERQLEDTLSFQK